MAISPVPLRAGPQILPPVPLVPGATGPVAPVPGSRKSMLTSAGAGAFGNPQNPGTALPVQNLSPPASQTNTGNAANPTGIGPNGSFTTGNANPTNIDFSNQISDSLQHFIHGGFGQTPGQGVQQYAHPDISPDILNSMQKYSDAAYNQATSRLDPQFAQQKSAFDQQMVSQGLEPGSQAYNAALQNFNNSKNDAYAGARNAAMQQGLQAQGQAFGQGLAGSQLGLAANAQNWNQGLQSGQFGLAENQQGFNQGLAGSQLANELAKAQLGANAQVNAAHASAAGNVGAATKNAEASKYNSQNSLLSSLMGDQTSQYLGQLQNSLGWGNLGVNAAMGAGNLGLQQNNQNYNQMMGLYNAGQQTDMYNNAIPGMQMGNIQQLLNMIPNSGVSPVDVTGAYGLNANMQNTQYQGQVANNNAQNQTTGALASTAIMAAIML